MSLNRTEGGGALYGGDEGEFWATLAPSVKVVIGVC
jgi:hypothetical protein